ncbi:glycosyltransferase family 2 protein [Marinicella sp. W31]|uniref:glycosyltransferase family 2 protein n=1 Tax=Marinicella sp. W31 TaxID=3023713 RepID=UPI003756ED98
MRTLIVIPAFNEFDNLKELLPILREQTQADILIVNDCSTDNTAQVANDFDIHCLTLPLQLGAWGATQTGIRYALAHQYDQVITMDADGQHAPEDIHLLQKTFNTTQSHVVIGTDIERLSRAKMLAWRFFKSLTRLKIEDLTSGFRLYDAQAIQLLASKSASLLDYQDVGVLLLLNKAGLTVAEVPVKMRHRGDGKSRVFSSWWVVFKYMVQTTTLCIAKIGKRKTAL